MRRPTQRQPPPGVEAQMTPKPDRGETSDPGCDKPRGRVAVITGGDSGITGARYAVTGGTPNL